MSLFRNLLITILFSISATSYATIYFKYDAEAYPCDGSDLPNPPFWTFNSAYRGHTSCGKSPQGNKYIEFTTVAGQPHHFTEIHNTQNLPISNVMGKTFYLAWYFNFSRINGKDIWHETGASGDKGLEIVGSGIRWVLGRGQWGNMLNKDHHYTIFAGNPSYHLNRKLEINDIYVQNQSGYYSANTMQLPYDQWHSAVVALKIASDNTGSFTAYINGVKIIEYTNIKTAANDNPTITDIALGGTIAQGNGAPDAPAHNRRFDALLLTDSWQDIIDGGYLKTTPKAPIQSKPQ
ncbi:MAG: hypothetical protein GXP11_05175 [Gammaproteobacteria bacterium]|nr:hypothetical protein [Gammaproteobacteria bacterium]